MTTNTAHIEALKLALKLALEALESVTGHFTRTPSTLRDSEVRGEAHKAIAAIKEALAQPQKPVATMWQHGETGRTRITTPDSITDCDARWFKVSDLYTVPHHQTPLSLEDLERLHFKHAKYQEESMGISGWVEYARAIEAAHGITGEQK